MHGDCSPKTNYYSIIKRSAPESYRKKPCGVTKKVCNLPDWKHGYLINCSLHLTEITSILTPTDTRMIVRSTYSDWPITHSTDDLRRQRQRIPSNGIQLPALLARQISIKRVAPASSNGPVTNVETD